MKESKNNANNNKKIIFHFRQSWFENNKQVYSTEQKIKKKNILIGTIKLFKICPFGFKMEIKRLYKYYPTKNQYNSI